MGIRDEIRRTLRAGRRAANAAITAAGDGVEEWTAAREAVREEATFDERLEKAAKRAQEEGRDGTHDDHGFEDPDAKPSKGDPDGETDGDGLIRGTTFPGKHNPARDMKAITFDPFDLVSLMGWRERPTSLSFTAMERIAGAVPVIGDIVRTRCKQVETFCVLPEDRHAPGFEVRLRDRDVEPSDKTNARCRELEQIVLHCGFHDPTRPQDNESLKTFCGMFVRDSLSFDQACFEVVPDRKGDPSYFSAVDSTTIRLLDPIVAEQEDVFAVQVIQGSVVTDFSIDELAFCIRNPRSGIYTYGYGESEIETLIREITGFLWSIEYNRKFFTQGSATKGILNFKGTMPDKHMTAFRRQWYAMVSGVTNAWRTPITNAEDLQWINLQMNNRDMEYSAWMDFLIKVCCARFLIAPEEVNFSYGNTGQAAAMGGTSTEEKLKASKDLGLRPLVHWFFDQINRHFLWKLDADYEVVPVGLDSKGPEGEVELLTKQTSVFMLVDEARQAVGLEPLENDMGQVVLNPTWLQWAQSKDPAMQEDDGGFGDEDEAEGDNPDEDGGGEEDDHPTGGIGVADADGNDFEFDKDEPDEKPDEKPDVAKSMPSAIGSDQRDGPRPVRYEIQID